jgi:hypothetical protein
MRAIAFQRETEGGWIDVRRPADVAFGIEDFAAALSGGESSDRKDRDPKTLGAVSTRPPRHHQQSC